MDVVDTNILARYFLDDDHEQSPRARAILMHGAFVSNSVLLETAWLLQSRYNQSPKAISSALLALIAMPDVVVSDLTLLSWALTRYADGADVGDMLHLVEAAGHDCFLTFDRKLAKQAGDATPVHVKDAGK
jgi:predicted nucleic-acid-binding protein